jgi:hypothetical protein
MAFEKKPLILNGDQANDPHLKDLSFEFVVNSACERLWDKHAQYSIRRIREMDAELAVLERELDQFLSV